jgi:hypothetical protein
MKRDSVRSAVSALTSITAVNAWIQYSTANSEPSASSGRCQETERNGKPIVRYGDAAMEKRVTLNAMRFAHWQSGIGNPTVFYHQYAGRIVTWLRGTSVIDRGGDFPFLKDFIFWIPGKNKKGMI